VEARARLVATSGGRLHAGELGPARGRLLVLLHHGGAGYADDPWPDPFPALAAGPDPWRILRVDRLGYGRSDPRPAGFPPGFFAADLDQLGEVLETLAPGRPVVLQGTSDGGTLALLAAAAWPGRVRGCAVDGAHFRSEASMRPVLLDMRARFAEKHGPPRPDEPQVLTTLRAWIAGWLDIVAAGWSIEAELAAVRCPVAVLQGERDGIVDEAHAHALAAALGGPASVLILPEGEHLSQRSHPGPWAAWLTAFLAGLPREAGTA